MKTLIYILLVCLSSSCFAQKTLKDGRYDLDGKTFVIKKYKYGETSIVSILVGIGKDFENKAYPPPKNRYPFPLVKRDIHFDTALVKQIVLKTLAKKRESLKTKKAFISVSFTFRRDGKIEAISYALFNQPDITLSEVADIDKKLEAASIKASFTGRAYLDYEYLHYPKFDIMF